MSHILPSRDITAATPAWSCWTATSSAARSLGFSVESVHPLMDEDGLARGVHGLPCHGRSAWALRGVGELVSVRPTYPFMTTS